MINVQLTQDGPITQMDESQLLKREGSMENDNEITSWTEYWIPDAIDRPVHRSVHIHLKKGLCIDGDTGSFS